MKQQHSSTTTSQSVSRSVTQSTSQPSSLPEHCNHRQKQLPQSSTIRANHASTWLEYVRQLPCSRRACTKSSSASSYSNISLHHTARTDQQQRAAQTKRITPTTKTNTANEHSCVQQQVAVSKKKWCSTPLAHQNLPHSDARKVSNRIDDAIRTKPRSEEGERRCAMK